MTSKYRLYPLLMAVAAVFALSFKAAHESSLHLSKASPPSDDDRPPGLSVGKVDSISEVESGRGRAAHSPWQILWRDCKDILVRVYSDANDHRLLAVAGGLVFFVLLAIFPAIVALVSLYGLFADPATVSQHLSAIAGFVPPDSLKLLGDEVNRIASKSGGALGITTVVAILFAFWSANSGTKAIFDALNVAYDEKEKRSFIRLTLVSLAFTVSALFLLLFAAAAVVAVPLIFAAIGLEDLLATLLRTLRWPILLVLLGLALAVLYRYGPSRQKPKWRWVMPGSVIASLLWLAGSALFSFYLANFANYNATYGSLGALIGLLMWLWLTFVVILLGAELNAEIEDQR
jgi:membrane protein